MRRMRRMGRMRRMRKTRRIWRIKMIKRMRRRKMRNLGHQRTNFFRSFTNFSKCIHTSVQWYSHFHPSRKHETIDYEILYELWRLYNVIYFCRIMFMCFFLFLCLWHSWSWTPLLILYSIVFQSTPKSLCAWCWTWAADIWHVMHHTLLEFQNGHFCIHFSADSD